MKKTLISSLFVSFLFLFLPLPQAVGEEDVEINILVVYTPNARTWAEVNHGSIDNVIAGAIQETNLALDNSETCTSVRLAHSAEVDYTESGSAETDLRRLTGKDNGYMDIVHDWRAEHEADLVAMLIGESDYGGVAYLLEEREGRPDLGFSITRIQQAEGTGDYTFVHELGHNLGCHHHKEQNTQPGPTDWDDWEENTWSAGWRWTGKDGGKYCSVMTYGDGQYFDDGTDHTIVPFFSNPDIFYEGVPVGHAEDGDNARTIREIRRVVAGYGAPRMVLTMPGETFEAGEGNTGSPVPQPAGREFEVELRVADSRYNLYEDFEGEKELSWSVTDELDSEPQHEVTNTAYFTEGKASGVPVKISEPAEGVTLTAVEKGGVDGVPGSSFNVLVCIQNKVDNALKEGEDVIDISPGTYLVHHAPTVLREDDAGGVTLRATEGRSETFIEAAGKENAISIEAPGVTLDGFTIENFSGTGIEIKKSAENVTVASCTLENFSDTGIAVAGDNARVINTLIWGLNDEDPLNPVTTGILIDGAYGTRIKQSEIEDAKTGVKIGGEAEKTRIFGNLLTRNKTGIKNVHLGGWPTDTWAVHNNIFDNNIYDGGDVYEAGAGVSWEGHGEGIVAVYNWWGHRGGPTHANNPEGEGDKVIGSVDYIPFSGTDHSGGGFIAAGGEPGEDPGRGLALEADGGEVFVADFGDQNPAGVDFPHGQAAYFNVVISDKTGMTEMKLKIGRDAGSDNVVYGLIGSDWIECSDQKFIKDSGRFDGFDGHVEVVIDSDTTFPAIDHHFSGVVFAVGDAQGRADSDDVSGSGSNCFIATAVFGSADSRSVRVLRKFRDRYLLSTGAGRGLVRFYYRHGPAYAELISERPVLRFITGLMLLPVVASVYVFTGGYTAPLAVVFLFFVSVLFFLRRAERVKKEKC